MKAHVKTLFAEHWVSALCSANEQIVRGMFIRSDAASEAEMEAAKAARGAAQTAFEKLCKMIDALAVVNDDVAYKHIIDRINQLVTESHNMAACLHSCKKSGDATDLASPADPPDTPASSPVEE